MVKSWKIEIFENFEKSAPSKIENLVEISVFFNEMVIRPTNKVQETHLWYWFFKPDRLVKVSDFLKWFQSDFFKNRLKLEFFWVLLLSFSNANKKPSKNPKKTLRRPRKFWKTLKKPSRGPLKPSKNPPRRHFYEFWPSNATKGGRARLRARPPSVTFSGAKPSKMFPGRVFWGF